MAVSKWVDFLTERVADDFTHAELAQRSTVTIGYGGSSSAVVSRSGGAGGGGGGGAVDHRPGWQRMRRDAEFKQHLLQVYEGLRHQGMDGRAEWMAEFILAPMAKVYIDYPEYSEVEKRSG